MNLEWRQRSETTAFLPSGYTKVSTRDYLMPDGRISAWDVTGGGDSVAVVALTPDGRVVVTRQFRPGPGKVLTEIPGGAVGDGESIEVAGLCELAEETGYVGASAEYVGATWQAATVQLHQHVIVVRDAIKTTSQELDAEEFIDVFEVNLEEFRELLRRGECTDQGLAYRALDFLGLL